MTQTLILAQESGNGGGIAQLLFFVLLIGGFFYFLMIRPQKKQRQRHREIVESLEIGDRVRTGSGIFGIIRQLGEEDAVIEVEDGGLLRILRLAIVARVDHQD